MAAPEIITESEAKKRSPGIELLGALLAVVFVVLVLLATFVMGLAGTKGDTILQSQVVVGAVLLPLGWIAITALRQRLPALSADWILFTSVGVLLLATTFRFFNIGSISGEFVVDLPIALAFFVLTPICSAFAVADLFRFRSPRLAVVALLGFLIFSLPSPDLGFVQARECLTHRVEELQADLGDRSVARIEDGRCGVVAWTHATYEFNPEPQVIFANAGGLLDDVDGLIWSEVPLTSCQQTDVYFCSEVSELGDGWHSYRKYSPGAT